MTKKTGFLISESVVKLNLVQATNVTVLHAAQQVVQHPVQQLAAQQHQIAVAVA